MSHSPVDIFAAKDGKVLLIQVKSGKRKKISIREMNQFVAWAKAFNAEAQVWFFRTRGGLERMTVYPSATGRGQ